MYTRTITVVPRRGATLAKQTYLEWVQNYPFKVVASSTPKFRRGHTITFAELDKDREYHNTEYDVHFEVLTPAEYYDEQSAVNHDYGNGKKVGV